MIIFFTGKQFDSKKNFSSHFDFAHKAKPNKEKSKPKNAVPCCVCGELKAGKFRMEHHMLRFHPEKASAKYFK